MANAIDNDLDLARQRVEKLRARLPCLINFANLGVQSQAPYLLYCIRAALSWRTEELARCACDALAKDDVAAGILLTRAVIESAAFIWRLKELLEYRQKYSPDDLRAKFENIPIRLKQVAQLLREGDGHGRRRPAWRRF
jgi:hypothetical protein